MPIVQVNKDLAHLGVPAGAIIPTQNKEVTGIWVTDGFGDPLFLVKGEYTLLPDGLQ